MEADAFAKLPHKTLAEIFLYCYSKRDDLKKIPASKQQIDSAFVYWNFLYLGVGQAFDELEESLECSDCKEAIADYANQFRETSLSLPNPLAFWGKQEEANKAFIETLHYFFDIFSIFEKYGYDLSNLLKIEIPC